MRVIGGQVFDLKEGFVERELCTSGSLLSESSGDGQVLDAAGCYVIPGLVDVHFHGCVGEDFSDATPDGLQRIADYELSQGVTYICPAGMTLPEDQLTAICKNAAAHRAKNTNVFQNINHCFCLCILNIKIVKNNKFFVCKFCRDCASESNSLRFFVYLFREISRLRCKCYTTAPPLRCFS